MSSQLETALAAEMARWESAGLRRELRDADPGSREREFASNDTLGLSAHPEVIEGAREALAEFGAGGRAARLLGGGSPLDEQVERMVAAWLGAESALLFPTGYQANLGLVSTLAAPGDLIVSDALNHASLIDAARLSRARVAVHRHLDVEHVEHLLARGRSARRRFVLTEGVFSMDGDAPDLAALAAVCAEHDAFLIVDEAHAAGVVGPAGAGAWAAAQADGADPARLCARVVTGGKALGAAGGLVVSSRAVREHLLNRARPFVFSTAVSPAISGALTVSVRLASEDDSRRERAVGHARRIAEALGAPAPAAAIVPHLVGEEWRAMALSAGLGKRGLDVRAVRPPTVPPGSSRLRLSAHAHNSDEAVDELIAALAPTRLASAENETATSTAVAARPARVLTVVGTDTDIGKTVVAALLTAAAAARAEQGRPVAYWKPVQTGTDSDTEEVRRLVGASGVRFLEPAHEFPLPASPHEAAAAAGGRIDTDAVRTHWRGLAKELSGGTMIVELAGGLMVPWEDELTQADVLAAQRPDLVLVARSALGTLNHTLLTLEALAARALHPRALFLVGERHRSNRETLARLGGVAPVYELETLDPLDADALTAWLARNDLSPVFDP
ncbi:MAG: dethiobiotin synthase [Planctomycetota bacterium]